MSLTGVLNNLVGASKERFLEDFLSSATTLNDADFEIVRKAAFDVNIDLGVKYLLAQGKDEEAVTALEKAATTSEKIAEKRRRYTAAAELCIALGMKDRAIVDYEHAGEIKKAAEVYLGVEYLLFEIGQNANEKISLLEEAKKHAEAAELCKKYGMTIRAVKNLKLAGSNQEADELEKNTDPVKAAAVWERNHNPTEADNLLYINGFFKELAATHERADHFVSAGSTYDGLLHDPDSALRCYMEARFDHGVEKILQEQGKTNELVAYWKKTDNIIKLATHYEDKEPEKAAGFYIELKAYHKAAICLVKARKTVEVLELLVGNNLYEDALKTANTFEASEQAKVNELITKCYMELAPRCETSEPERALEFYSKLNDEGGIKRVATHLMEQAVARGNFTAAANYAIISGDNNKAQTFREANALLKPA